MLLFGWSTLILLFPCYLLPIPILWWLYRGHQLQLVSPSLSCSIGFFFSFLARSWYLSLYSLSFSSTLWSARIIIINIVVNPWEFFPPASADGFSLEFGWQQVSRTLLSILTDLLLIIILILIICTILILQIYFKSLTNIQSAVWQRWSALKWRLVTT